jgi:hypothetical protein
MIVVGGTYVERTDRPFREEIYGSGLRAAIALALLDPKLDFITGVDAESRVSAVHIAREYSVDAEWIERDEPVRFRYFTPLSAPVISGRLASLERPIVARGHAALVFGMIERPAREIEVDRLVFDPQQPGDILSLDVEGIKANRIAYVLNRAEAAAITRELVPEKAAISILEASHAEAVVVKCGAQGALVASRDGVDRIGAYPTERVWPLGSGDVFAAGFAHAWAVIGIDALAAARFGSKAAAYMCGGNRLPLPHDFGEWNPAHHEVAPQEAPVYLAGPFFTLAEQWLVELARTSLSGLGATVFSPLHDVGHGGPQVAREDLEGLAKCRSVLAILDGADSGTWFEVGWAHRAGIPVIGYCEPQSQGELKMAVGNDIEVHTDLSTAVYRAIWAAME